MLNDPPLSELVRALLAIALAASLPVILYFGGSGTVEDPITGSEMISAPLQAYMDVLAAAVAFYFGQTSNTP
jgi:hypothetical protein